MQGNVLEIGGLGVKVQGAAMAGVETVIYPSSNQHDIDKFIEKNCKNDLIKGIVFKPVSNISDIIKLVY